MFPLKDDNPSATAPLVTVALIVLNALVFVYQISLQVGGPEGARAAQAFVEEFGLVPCRLTGACHIGTDVPAPMLTIFTSMFMHGGFFHIAGNMLYLWIFGDNVEDRFGHAKYAIFYGLCGIAATLAQVLVNAGSNVPNLGASGAIAGVLAAYIILFPKGQVKVLMGRGVVPMPALVVIGLWIVLQFINGIGSIAQTAETGGVAYMAHIGGFVAGLVLTFLFGGRRTEVTA